MFLLESILSYKLKCRLYRYYKIIALWLSKNALQARKSYTLQRTFEILWWSNKKKWRLHTQQSTYRYWPVFCQKKWTCKHVCTIAISAPRKSRACSRLDNSLNAVEELTAGMLCETAWYGDKCSWEWRKNWEKTRQGFSWHFGQLHIKQEAIWYKRIEN